MTPPTANLNLDVEAISGICGYVSDRSESQCYQLLIIVVLKFNFNCLLGYVTMTRSSPYLLNTTDRK